MASLKTTDQRIHMLEDQRLFIERQVDTLLLYTTMINHKIEMYNLTKTVSNDEQDD